MSASFQGTPELAAKVMAEGLRKQFIEALRGALEDAMKREVDAIVERTLGELARDATEGVARMQEDMATGRLLVHIQFREKRVQHPR